jgi:Co/Zn/Cd efflux system component
MDCPSEENLIRIRLDEIDAVKRLDFNIPERELIVYHLEQTEQIEQAIMELGLGGKRIVTEKANQSWLEENTNQSKMLLSVLIINFGFFLIEIIYGVLSKSMGLIADSLDMLADSFVYGISLFAVGKSLITKKNVAKLAGYCQIVLALVGFLEVIRRFYLVSDLPDFSFMIIVSFLALIANALCLYILQKSKSKNEAHIRASLIFTSNDIIINLGVVLAGVLVHFLNSNKPDLVVGGIVFTLVLRGALRILKLGK